MATADNPPAKQTHEEAPGGTDIDRRQTVQKGQPCLTAVLNPKIRTMQHRVLFECQNDSNEDFIEVDWPNPAMKLQADGKPVKQNDKTLRRKLPVFHPAYVNKAGEPKFALEILNIEVIKFLLEY